MSGTERFTTERKLIAFAINPERVSDLKIAAACEGLSVSGFIRSLIEEKLSQNTYEIVKNR